MGMNRNLAKAAILLILTVLVVSMLNLSPMHVNAAEVGLSVVMSVDQAPDFVWNYLVTEVGTGDIIEGGDFTLPAAGDAIESFSYLASTGGDFNITQIPKYGYTTDIIIYGDLEGTIIDNSAIISLPEGGSVTVAFVNNYTGPSFQEASVEGLPPSDMKFNIPVNKPMPVQAAFGANFDNSADGSFDLVVNKPMAILVNLTGIPPDSTPVTVSAVFEGITYTNAALTGNDLATDSVVSFHPIIPRVLGTKSITGSYLRLGVTTPLTSTLVKVNDTSILPLYFAYYTKPSNYGNVPQFPNYNYTAVNIVDFINATYPVKEVRTNTNYLSVTGNARESSYKGAKKDALRMVSNLLASSGLDTNAVGIAIEPEAYFNYHGFPAGVVGVSWGPAVQGVIVKDGWIVTGAHEVAHTIGTKGQYYPKEYYSTAGLKNTIVSGVSPQNAQWRTGYCFMDVAVDYQSTSATWINSYTYKNLFTNFTKGLHDPEILIATGIIYNGGTDDASVEFVEGAPWIHKDQGTPHELEPGNFSLKFWGGETLISETSFNPLSFMEIDPGAGIGENELDLSLFGPVETDGAPFAFATAFPEGTTGVQLVDKTNPEQENELAWLTLDDITFIESPTVQVTFATSGLGSDIGAATVLRIDGTDYTYSQLLSLSFNWIPGSTHSVTVFSPVAGGGRQYAFIGWTNGDGLTSGTSTYTVPDSDTTVTANYIEVPMNVIPEVELGTLAVLATLAVTFLGYTAIPRLRKNASKKK
jgi:hypothetical protein